MHTQTIERPTWATRHVEVETGDGLITLSGYVAADADYDGTFKLWCEDTHELLGVHGWLVSDITWLEP